MVLFLSGPGKQGNKVEEICICYTPTEILPLSELLTMIIFQSVSNAVKEVNEPEGGWVTSSLVQLRSPVIEDSQGWARKLTWLMPFALSVNHPHLWMTTSLMTNWENPGDPLDFPLEWVLSWSFVGPAFKESPGCPVLVIHQTSSHYLFKEKVELNLCSSRAGFHIVLLTVYSQHPKMGCTCR